MDWAEVFSPTGCSYSCSNDLRLLLASSSCGPHSKAVPFDADVTILSRVCRQMCQDTPFLPFKLWVRALEDTFILDQFVTAGSLESTPVRHKEAIRKVAVAPPGHHQLHEELLKSLQEAYLIRGTHPVTHADQVEGSPSASRQDMICVRRDTLTDTWLRSE